MESKRIESVDALRGLVMIIMALDHTRDYFHSAALQFAPEDLTRTTAAIFLTRWITHFCAPVFMFTAGLAAWFWQSGGRTPDQLTGYLVKRGLWLALLEVTVLRAGYNFGFLEGPVLLTILWALGWSMVIVGLLARMPMAAMAAVCAAAIALHNLADGLPAASWIWRILHQRGAIVTPAAVVVVGYPLIPWFGVMGLGYCAGKLMALDGQRRRRWLVRIGAAATAAFVLLRFVNVYGDPQKWQPPGVLSFLNCQKYPPSLDFLLMTLGPALLVLAWLDGRRLRPGNPLLVFGRVPLFYFIGHLYLIHALTIPFALARYGTAAFVFGSPPAPGAYPQGYGYPLPVVYAVWIAVVLAMYPLSRWFGAWRKTRTDWWLAYV